VVGSTALERLSPDEVKALIGECVSRMSTAVEEFDGTIQVWGSETLITRLTSPPLDGRRPRTLGSTRKERYPRFRPVDNPADPRRLVGCDYSLARSRGLIWATSHLRTSLLVELAHIAEELADVRKEAEGRGITLKKLPDARGMLKLVGQENLYLWHVRASQSIHSSRIGFSARFRPGSDETAPVIEQAEQLGLDLHG
jgi:hypothetical protein